MYENLLCEDVRDDFPYAPSYLEQLLCMELLMLHFREIRKYSLGLCSEEKHFPVFPMFSTFSIVPRDQYELWR